LPAFKRGIPPKRIVYFQSWLAASEKSDALRKMFAAYAGGEGGLRLIRAARDLDPQQTEHLGEALRACGVPALVLWGQHDTIFPVDTATTMLGAPTHSVVLGNTFLYIATPAGIGLTSTAL
jgi:pimeloyl-ACP methyl ester carboxylesterase